MNLEKIERDMRAQKGLSANSTDFVGDNNSIDPHVLVVGGGQPHPFATKIHSG